jgi:hypothetical protein
MRIEIARNPRNILFGTPASRISTFERQKSSDQMHLD